MSEQGKRLIAAVRAVAAERPEHVYERALLASNLDLVGPPCVYVFDGKPSCLIGQGLWRLELIDADFEESAANDEPALDAFGKLGLELDADEVNWLGSVQNRQDKGDTWGEALLWADKYDPLDAAA